MILVELGVLANIQKVPFPLGNLHVTRYLRALRAVAGVGGFFFKWKVSLLACVVAVGLLHTLRGLQGVRRATYARGHDPEPENHAQHTARYRPSLPREPVPARQAVGLEASSGSSHLAEAILRATDWHQSKSGGGVDRHQIMSCT